MCLEALLGCLDVYSICPDDGCTQSGVWKGSGGCLESTWELSRGCLKTLMVSGVCVGVLRGVLIRS